MGEDHSASARERDGERERAQRQGGANEQPTGSTPRLAGARARRAGVPAHLLPPLAEELREVGELLRSQEDQRQQEQDGDLTRSEVEHGSSVRGLALRGKRRLAYAASGSVAGAGGAAVAVTSPSGQGARSVTSTAGAAANSTTTKNA